MCNCSTSSCGCATVKGRRGQRGLDGATGPAGTGAQVLSGDGPPSVDPTPVTAYALYQDTATGGHWWQWTPGSPGAWTDTGDLVSGADGADGANAWTLTPTPSPEPVIPTDGGVFSLTVQDTTWMGTGQLVHITNFANVGLGYYEVFTLVSATQVFLRNPRDAGAGEYLDNSDGTAAFTVTNGSKVSPGGIQGPAGLPMVTSFGAPDPTVAPAGGASGWYVQSGTGGTYWYYNGPSGPWTDTLQPVIGPTGLTGPAGTNGTTPVITRSTLAPNVGSGANGDLHFQFANPGLIRTWLKSAGVWGYSSANDVVANRMLGFSTSVATPNPSFIAQNAGDQWWTYIGTQVTMYMAVDSATWTVAMTFATGGGGGGNDLPTTIAATTGQLSGTLPVNWQRTNFEVARSVNTSSPGGTIQFDTDWGYHDLTIDTDTGTSVTLNYTDPTSGYYSEWVFMLQNTLATQVNIFYTANQWKVPSGVSHPVLLSAAGTNGDTAILHCYFYKGYMWISKVDINPTIL